MENKSWFILYSTALIGFLVFSLFLGGDYPVDGMRNIVNLYITINTTILAVSLAAIVIKQGTECKSILPQDYFVAIVMTAVGVFSSIYALYLSYVPIISLFTQKILFGVATAFTFIAIMSMVYLIMQFKPIKE
ncbi:MAG: hypothetical protein NTV87_11495 [Ignavibacteriae bacterium]|nr:hypothetical protein [Ignavibacteriota bacterium]